jgi:tRNA A37 threonylcarbamoyltransferase TsaD
MKILTTSNWDGFAMGRTIALKLSEKEDQIVTQLNKQGISNSELLRTAPQDPEMENLFLPDKITKKEFSESFKGLKQELHELWEHIEKTQKQVDNNVMTIQRQMYLLSIGDIASKQVTHQGKSDIVCDVHNEVDEFLKRRSQQTNL